MIHFFRSLVPSIPAAYFLAILLIIIGVAIIQVTRNVSFLRPGKFEVFLVSLHLQDLMETVPLRGVTVNPKKASRADEMTRNEHSVLLQGWKSLGQKWWSQSLENPAQELWRTCCLTGTQSLLETNTRRKQDRKTHPALPSSLCAPEDPHLGSQSRAERS